jgi:restriction system protein
LNGDGRPSRVVTWLKTDLARDAIKQDLLYSLGASQTVCEVARNQASARFEAIVSSGRDPGYLGDASKPQSNASSDEGEAEVDFSITARDQIERHIASTFAGHAFTELIAAILRAQGYQTRVSPPGADKGVDIVAGQGTLGFNGPKLVVQVKSGDVVIDQPTLQGLLGSIQDVHADQGLLVSWSGFRGAVTQRTNELFFRVRLWGRAEIMDALFSVYERLPEDIRAELPLRRTWSLVTEE